MILKLSIAGTQKSNQRIFVKIRPKISISKIFEQIKVKTSTFSNPFSVNHPKNHRKRQTHHKVKKKHRKLFEQRRNYLKNNKRNDEENKLKRKYLCLCLDFFLCKVFMKITRIIKGVDIISIVEFPLKMIYENPFKYWRMKKMCKVKLRARENWAREQIIVLLSFLLQNFQFPF